LSSVTAAAERIGFEAAKMLDQLMRAEQPDNRNERIEPLGVADQLAWPSDTRPMECRKQLTAGPTQQLLC
jgi:hypothetical protein